MVTNAPAGRRLDGEAWAAFKQQVQDWRAERLAWANQLSAQRQASNALVSDIVLQHGEHAGRPITTVIAEMIQQIIEAQARFLLRLYEPVSINTEDEDDRQLQLTILDALWGVYASPFWNRTTPADLRVHVSKHADARMVGVPPWVTYDPDVMAHNRAELLIYADIVGKGNPRYTAIDYIKDREEEERHPYESILARWVRKSRPYAAIVFIVAGLVVFAIGQRSGMLWVASAGIVYFVVCSKFYDYLVQSLRSEEAAKQSAESGRPHWMHRDESLHR